MKNFWKYFTITFLLLLGLACVGVLYMFFVGGPLFNLKYISNNKDVLSNSYALGDGAYQVDTIVLSSHNFPVQIKESQNNEISLKIHNGVFGFVTLDNSDLHFSEDYVLGELDFSVTEPHGLATMGSSKITLFLPKQKEFNLVLINNGADTTFNAGSVTINNLSYTTKSGDFKISAGKILGDLQINLGRATFSIDDGVDISKNKVDLWMTSGCLNCFNKDFGTINIMSSTSGIVRALSCTSLLGKNENAGGGVSIGAVGNVNFVGGDTNVKIDELQFGTIDLKKSGKVEIGEIKESSRIDTNSGKIAITEAHSFELFLNSNSGNINVNESFGNINATTLSGDITVTFSDNANSFGAAESQARRFFATTNSGDISAYGVENTEIKINDNGNLTLYMNDVLKGNNIIDVEKGSIYVQIKELTEATGVAHYKLSWETQSGGVSVNLAHTHALATGGDHDKQKEIYVNDNDHTSANAFYIKSKAASIMVRDSITKNF